MAANPPEVATPHVGKGLTHKLGPLPVWGWIVVGGVIIGVGYLAYNAYQNAQGNTTSTPSLSDLGSLLGGSGTPTGTPVGTTTTTTPTTALTNTAWLQPLISSVAAATGYSSQEVSLYLNEYLAGFQPVGVPGGTDAFQTIVKSALSLGGAPPQAPPPVNLNANYFTSEQAYFNELQTFLPSGTSQSVIQELQNFFNGTTTQISQDAANALSAAQSIVGNGPNALTYTITGSGGGTAAPPLAVTVAQIQSALSSSQGTQTGWVSTLQALANLPSTASTALNNAYIVLQSAAYQPYVNSSLSGSLVDSATAFANQVTIINALLNGQTTPLTSTLLTKPKAPTVSPGGLGGPART